MNELLKEKIKYYTEWIRLLAVALLTNIAGIISLFRLKTPGDYFFIFLGILITFAIGIIIYFLNRSVQNAIEKLAT